MNIPLMPVFPSPDAPSLDDEDREGCEFVNGMWVPKHPDYPVKKSHDRKGHEFVDGEWKEKNLSGVSSLVGVRVRARLSIHVETAKLGFVLDGECGYQIHPDEPRRVRKPDFSFLRLAVLPDGKVPKGNIRIVPDLAGEVVSTNDEAVDLNNKITEYLRAGVRLVWILYPESRTVWIFRQNGSGNWLMGDVELNGEDIVPGFSVSLATLFADI